jgi:hypothetical protein
MVRSILEDEETERLHFEGSSWLRSPADIAKAKINSLLDNVLG